ncbi:MAG TPA: alginate lyase family protein [Blastocatellia bacterium]|nr:alginate lyase family protein [Blastocatellia bacterium]
MNSTAAKLNKIRGMSLGEVIGRGRQEFAKLTDRLLIAGANEMSDKSLYHEFATTMRNGSGEGSAETLRERWMTGSGFFLPSFAERPAIVEMMERRFPVEREAIIATAEKSLAGRLDLLGFSDLDFGRPIDWRLNPLTGDLAPLVHWSKIDPVAPIGKGDLKVFWEVQRNMHFVTLGQAYWLTGDHRYAEAFVEQASSWIGANPVGMGVGWAASLDVSFRAIQWLWALLLCADSRAVTGEFVASLLKSLIEHGRHIEKYLSLYFSPNTHLTGEALGLFYLGVALPELRRAEGWREAGLRILLDQLPKHVRSDGVYFEQASYYHRYTADFYTHALAMIRANRVALPREEEQMLRRKLEAAFDHLMWISRPDGSWPLFGDDDGGRLIKLAPRPSNDFRDTLAIGAALFERGDWKRAAGEAPAEMLWLLGPEAVAGYDSLKAEAPDKVSRAFETGGYFVMRDGWERDSSFALIDCGPHGSEPGRGHAHSDALAFELAIRGETWLVDPATYVYGSDAKVRNWFRCTRAHNTATVDGEDQSLTSAPFAWKTSANSSLIRFDDLGDCVIFEGSHDGYHRLSDPVTHARSVVMLRKRPALIVSDRFMAHVRHSYTIRYHFAPNCDVNARDNRVEARMPNGESLVISFFAKGAGLSGVKAWVEGGWVSVCYGQRAEAPVAVFEASSDGPTEITTVIVGCPARDIESGDKKAEWEEIK